MGRQPTTARRLTRRCGMCRVWQHLGAFNVRRASADGRQAYCKRCSRIYNNQRPRPRKKAA